MAPNNSFTLRLEYPVMVGLSDNERSVRWLWNTLTQAVRLDFLLDGKSSYCTSRDYDVCDGLLAAARQCIGDAHEECSDEQFLALVTESFNLFTAFSRTVEVLDPATAACDRGGPN